MGKETNQAIPPTSLLKVGDVARILNIHPNTVRRWEKQDLIQAWRVGPRGDRRFAESDVISLLKNQNGVENRKP